MVSTVSLAQLSHSFISPGHRGTCMVCCWLTRVLYVWGWAGGHLSTRLSSSSSYGLVFMESRDPEQKQNIHYLSSLGPKLSGSYLLNFSSQSTRDQPQPKVERTDFCFSIFGFTFYRTSCKIALQRAWIYVENTQSLFLQSVSSCLNKQVLYKGGKRSINKLLKSPQSY